MREKALDTFQKNQNKLDFVRERERQYQANAMISFIEKSTRSSSHVKSLKARMVTESEVNRDLRLEKESQVSKRLRMQARN